VQPYLSRHEWPGNIREFENAIERAVVLGASDMIELEDLPEAIRDIPNAAGASAAVPLWGAVDEAKRQAIPGFRAGGRRSPGGGQAAGRESELLVPADAELRYAVTLA